MGEQHHNDPVMGEVRRRLESSGMTYQELGEKMGYAPSSARQAVAQFLKAKNPTIGLLRRFADATGISVKSLL